MARQRKALQGAVARNSPLGLSEHGLHPQPGISLDPYLLRTRQHFLPMTDAILRSRIDPTWEQQLPVVIVNMQHMMELRSQLSVV